MKDSAAATLHTEQGELGVGVGEFEGMHYTSGDGPGDGHRSDHQ